MLTRSRLATGEGRRRLQLNGLYRIVLTRSGRMPAVNAFRRHLAAWSHTLTTDDPTLFADLRAQKLAFEDGTAPTSFASWGLSDPGRMLRSG